MIIWDLNINPEKYIEVMNKLDSCLFDVGIPRQNHASYIYQSELEKNGTAHLHKWYVLYWTWSAIDEAMGSGNKKAIKKIYDLSEIISSNG
jgi:hypothetical protein